MDWVAIVCLSLIVFVSAGIVFAVVIVAGIAAALLVLAVVVSLMFSIVIVEVALS